MKTMAWLMLAALAVAGVLLAIRARRKWQERERAESERFAAFMAASAAAKLSKEATPTMPAPVVPAPPALAPADAPAALQVATQKLLFDAAHKAGEAGEPALAIQLYARLLSRYPASGFAEAARAAVDGQKKKLDKP